MKSLARTLGSRFGLAWPEGDFYVPRFSADGRTALVPGAADTHRLLFLVHASALQPELLRTLRTTENKKTAVRAWAKRWHLNDEWCVLMALETRSWWSQRPEATGWYFKDCGIIAMFYPFAIKPIRFEEFLWDPTQRRRRVFERYVMKNVQTALKEYMDRVEADARAAGLKRVPRKTSVEHFQWLVRHQIMGESFAEIAQSASYQFNGGRQTIRKAVVELATYLSLTLRPSS